MPALEPTVGVFDLSSPGKADPASIDGDERHFAAIAASLAESLADLTARLDAARKAPGGRGRRAADRDDEIRRLTARLRTLRRFSLDVCLGRMVGADGEPVYVGRLGLTDRDGRRLLVDWRSPVAGPFFGATHADPMGLVSRRRYRWTGGRVSDYWDEVFTADALDSHAALDDQSAFIAGLGAHRSARMRDVLATIQADQDAIIRAGSRGALVVDGGPGTGKTVVALHRTAYLLYSDPRLQQRQGGVLFVGPHEPYLAYVGDVLPNLGEDEVQTCTLRDLVPGVTSVAPEPDPAVAALKSTTAMVDAVEAAVAFYEQPPATALTIATDDADLRLTAADWAQAFAAPGPGTPHNEARDQVWDEMVTILLERYDGDEPEHTLRRTFAEHRELTTTLRRAWPLLDAADVIADLWSVPAYLRRCAPGLDAAAIRALQRADAQAWTVSDLPLLDAARHRLGEKDLSQRQRRAEATRATERDRMARVLDDLIASTEYDDGEGLMTMLVQPDLRDVLADDPAVTVSGADRLAGPFAHIVVDEAQELTDAEWQMLLRRCPSRSFTIVGDRAQARHGFTESWAARLARIGLPQVTLASLTVNYRTPAEVMAEAEPVIRAVRPDANVPTSIRTGGVPVVHGNVLDLDRVLTTWDGQGTACVIGHPGLPDGARIRSLTPELAKGLEFDLVVLVDPDRFGAGIEGAVDRYVAMTRATHRLVVLTGSAASGGR